MKVLMITPGIDESHDILGFIPTWVRKLAERVDKLYVITFHHDIKTELPDNVAVCDVNKMGVSRLGKFIRFSSRLLHLNYTMLRIVPKVDVVFCHMYPDFTLMSAPYAKLFRKSLVTWYTHGHVSLRLRIAHLLVNKMVTASKESFRIKSHKVIITGHGIDTDRFKPAENLAGKKKSKTTILSVGRISPRKNIETLIKATDILVNEKGMKDLTLVIVGGVPVASQEPFFEELKNMVNELELGNHVEFVGSVPYSNVVNYYQQCDLFVTGSRTGSIDKNVLEAMACEKPAIACNEPFENVFGVYSKLLLFNKEDPYDLAQKIASILKMDKDQRKKVYSYMREIVKSEHDIDGLTDKLVEVFESCRR